MKRSVDKNNKDRGNIAEGKIIEQLRREWQKIEAKERREKLFDKVKTGSKEIGKWILIAAALSGILIVAAMAPNVFSAFGRGGLYRRFYKRSDAQKALKNLKQLNLIEIIRKEDEGVYLKITPKAKKKLKDFYIEKLTINRPEKWDGLWRIVIFDIPKKASAARDALRKKLKQLGFYRLQMSTFIYPFECEEEINFLKEFYVLDDWVRYVKANYIDNEIVLKKEFNL